MKLNQKVLITIGREYGSGGHAVAVQLSKDLDIPFFDKNLLAKIAKEHGYDEAVLESSDERLTNPFFDPYSTGSVTERLYPLQCDIIREEADKGSAIFVGRCANDVLRNYPNVVNIFIFADRNDRISRIMDVEHIDDSIAAEKIVKRIDKTRKSYYQFYTDKKWGSVEGMDLLLNSSMLGIEGTVHLIEAYLREKGYLSD